MKNLAMKFVNKLTNIGGSLQTPIAILASSWYSAGPGNDFH